MSTSTVGHEERKPLIDAYVFERRLLLGCSTLIGVALIFWIVAIATDHWIIISGMGGIYLPSYNRYFLLSHAGLWRICRYSSVPIGRENLTIALNFTSLTYQNSTLNRLMRAEVSKEKYIEDYLQLKQPANFTDDAKKLIFAYWVKGDNENFQRLKSLYEKNFNITTKKDRKVVKIDSSMKHSFLEIYKDQIMNITISTTNFYYVIPKAISEVLFPDWYKKPRVPKLAYPFIRDLGIPPLVIGPEDEIFQLVPPKPPKKERFANGFEYVPLQRCRYIDMFPSNEMVLADQSIDDEVLDFIRTQASFGCLTLIIMIMGCVFSAYTFLNPRYMFKRLAGGIHLISAATSLVVIQILRASADYQQEHIAYSYPEGAQREYGYGVYIAWLVFTSNLFAGLMFMWYSKKKKGNKAPTDDIAMADEPTIIGR